MVQEDAAVLSDGPSVLSLIAAGFYAVIVIACLISSSVAVRFGQPARHWQTWAMIALMFLCLAVIRVTGFEELLRGALRDALRADAVYADRRAIQGPLAAAVMVGGGLLAGFMLWRQSRTVKGRRNLALLVAKGSALVLGLLIVLRIISLHQVDSLLYGPPKLNWVIDLGASALVLASAAIYAILVRQRP
jgi:hypothetical protein